MLSPTDWSAIRLTLELASVTTALPLVLPPTVIGFYLLVAMGPSGPVGQFTQSLGLGEA